MATPDLNTLILKRGQLKAHLTRFSNYVSNFDESSDPVELETRLNNTIAVLPRFEDIQGQIEILSQSGVQENEREQ